MPKSISKINKSCYLVYKKNINKILYKKKNCFFKKFLLIKHKATKKNSCCLTTIKTLINQSYFRKPCPRIYFENKNEYKAKKILYI